MFTAQSPVNTFPVCNPRVKGQGSLVSQMKVFIDPEDEIFLGFLLR